MVQKFLKHGNVLNRRCSKCGREISNGYFGVNDYTMPYGSKFDYDTMNLTLCVDCLDELVLSCKINPITEYAGGREAQRHIH